jgi:hypothetical protein
MNLTVNDVTAANTENLLDLAIDTINLYGNQSISNMTGAAGSKTASLTQREKSAVFILARALYHSFYRDTEPTTVGGLSITPTEAYSNFNVQAVIKHVARQLTTRSILRT